MGGRDGLKEGRMEGRKDGRKEGWKEGRKEGWKEGRKDRKREGGREGRREERGWEALGVEGERGGEVREGEGGWRWEGRWRWEGGEGRGERGRDRGGGLREVRVGEGMRKGRWEAHQ